MSSTGRTNCRTAEQFTAQLGALVKEKVALAVSEATEAFFKGEGKATKPKAKPEAEAVPKPRKRRRRKAAKKAAVKVAATTPAPEAKPAE